MKIIVDAMGGDNAPQEIVAGALAAVKARPELEMILVGREAEVRAAAGGALPSRVSVVNATEVIDMHDDPAKAFRSKPDSSITVGLTMLRDGQGDAFVSAGNTGALFSAATLIVKRIRGIRRAAMAPVVPTGGGGSVLIDCGATAEGTPEFLLQFAFMGSYYAERVLGRPEPRVGLLNIGAEPSKGTGLQREAYQLLQKAKEEGRINFVGNVEAREAVEGAVDVIVADGYSGNIFLKAVEGAGLFLSREMKKMFMKSLKTKLAALLMKDGLRDFKKLLDANEVGGTALLGISKPVIKAHGSSNGYAMKNAVRQAVEFSRSGIVEDITENVEHMRLPAHSAAADGGGE